MTTVERYHDISAGHRVWGHESKCKHLHGHNYRVHFKVATIDEELDSVGRVVDFSVIKSELCQWLEDNWDHKMLLCEDDPLIDILPPEDIWVCSFNPTAENMARHLVEEVSPRLMGKHGCAVIECKIEETRKCSATYTKYR